MCLKSFRSLLQSHSLWLTQNPVFVYKYIDANARAGNEFRSYGKAVSGRVIKKSFKEQFYPKSNI